MNGDYRDEATHSLRDGQEAKAFFLVEALKSRRYVDQLLTRAGDRQAPEYDLRTIALRVIDDGTRGVTRAAGNSLVLPSVAPLGDAYEQELKLGDERRRWLWRPGQRSSFSLVAVEELPELLERLRHPVPNAQDTPVFISYVLGKDGSLAAFVADPESWHFVRLTVSAEAVTSRVQALRAAAADRHSGESWMEPGRWLGANVLRPALEVAPEDTDTLYVSGDGPLSNLVWPLLVLDDEPLVASVRAHIVPSASVLRRLEVTQIEPTPPHVLAFGNPTYSVPLESLPEAEREAELVASLFVGSSALLREDATEAALRERARDFNVLHFATHGLLLGDLAPMASSLLVAPSGEDDGFLSAAEIGALNLGQPRLVMLSACETAVSESRDGSDSLDLDSLSGAFFTAGARTVVGSLWQVNDRATTELMIALYRKWRTKPLSVALQSAQNEARKRPGWAHPYYWAAFVQYGIDA